MNRFSSPLDHVRIAAHCEADWEQMFGTDRVRFCGQCSLNVYNLSSMTKTEAESLIARTEGRLCVRFYRRKDGSILSRNCPVGIRVIKRRLSILWRAASAAVLSFFAGLGVYQTVGPALMTTPRMGVMVEMGQVAMKDPKLSTTPPNAFEMGKVGFTPLQSLAERRARRHRDRLRTEPTR